MGLFLFIDCFPWLNNSICVYCLPCSNALFIVFCLYPLLISITHRWSSLYLSPWLKIILFLQEVGWNESLCNSKVLSVGLM